MTKRVWVEIEAPEGWAPGCVWPAVGVLSRGALPVLAVHHTPPAPAISPEAQAALDAAVAWADAYRDAGMHGDPYVAVVRAACEAVDAYRATLAPPDPLDEVRRHLRDIAAVAVDEYMANSAEAALAALDRAKGVR